jgi:hypothetical protein
MPQARTLRREPGFGNRRTAEQEHDIGAKDFKSHRRGIVSLASVLTPGFGQRQRDYVIPRSLPIASKSVREFLPGRRRFMGWRHDLFHRRRRYVR